MTEIELKKIESEYEFLCKEFTKNVSNLLTHSQTPYQIKHMINEVMVKIIEYRAPREFLYLNEHAHTVILNCFKENERIEELPF